MNVKKILKSVGFVVLVFAAFLLMDIIGGFFTAIVQAATGTEDEYRDMFISSIPCIIMFSGILIKTGRGYVLKSLGNGFFKGLLVGGYILVLGCYLIVAGLIEGINNGSPQPIGKIIWFLLAMIFAAGMREELMFRGILQNYIHDAVGRDSKKGIYISIIVSSLLFGAMHMVNLTMGIPFESVLWQSISAAVLGLYFGAVYARTNCIWVTVFLHCFEDIGALMSSGIFGVSDLGGSIDEVSGASQLPSLIIYTALTVFLLRPSKTNSISVAAQKISS